MKSYPARFFHVMSSILKKLIPAWVSLALACATSVDAAPPGFVEGHLKIVSHKEVELANGNPPGTSAESAESYAEYPLIIFSADGKKEVARVTADREGNYRASLPPGDYILDVQGRAPGHVRAKPRRFKVVSKQTVRLDMDIDTGVR